MWHADALAVVPRVTSNFQKSYMHGRNASSRVTKFPHESVRHLPQGPDCGTVKQLVLDRAFAILAPAEDTLGGINGQRLEVMHVPVVSLVVYGGLSHVQGPMEEPVQGLPCAGGDHHGLHGRRNGLYGFLVIDLVVV